MRATRRACAMRVDANIRARDCHARDATVNPRTVTSRASSSSPPSSAPARASARQRRQKSRRRITTSKHPILSRESRARGVDHDVECPRHVETSRDRMRVPSIDIDARCRWMVHSIEAWCRWMMARVAIGAIGARRGRRRRRRRRGFDLI